MNTYITFLLLLFVLPSVAPKLIQKPVVVISICFVLCLSIYSTRLLG